MTAALDRVHPRLMICGHFTGPMAATASGETEIINAWLVDERYRPVNPLVEIEL